MTDALVTVVIPTRNREALLKQAIASVVAQRYSSWELIVIDDGSLEPVSDEVCDGIENSRIIRFDDSRGVSAARNAGIDASRGEYIAFLDDDDLWLPEKLALQIRVFREHTNAGLVGGACEYIDEEGVVISRSRAPGAIVTNRELSIRVSLPGSMSNAVFRTSCLHEVGKFNDVLHRAEDWELFLRVSERYEVRAVPYVTAQIRTHTGYRRPTSYVEMLAARKVLHSRIPSYLVKRQAFAMTYWRISYLMARDGGFFLSSYYFLRSLISWPAPVRYGKHRVRPFLSIWRQRLASGLSGRVSNTRHGN